ITFDSNEGSAVAPITEYAGTAITAPAAPTRENYTFGGWFTDDGTFQNAYDFTVMPEGNITLYAKWTPIPKYTITFASNEGSAVAPITEYAGTAIAAPAEPTRDGYVFDGWFTDDGIFENEYVFTVMPAANITLYAKWLREYTITLYDGSEVYATFTAPAGTPLVAPPEPTKEGYVFGGWFTDNGTFEDEFNSTVMPAHDVDLYAKWTSEDGSFTVTVEGGSGSGKYFEGEIAVISAEAPSGKKFVKWQLGGVDYSTYPNFYYFVTRDAEFTAVFEDDFGAFVPSVVPIVENPLTDYYFITAETYCLEYSRIYAGYESLYLSYMDLGPEQGIMIIAMAVYGNGTFIAEQSHIDTSGTMMATLWGIFDEDEYLIIEGGMDAYIMKDYFDINRWPEEAINTLNEEAVIEITSSYFLIFDTNMVFYGISVSYTPYVPEEGLLMFFSLAGEVYCEVGGTIEDIIFEKLMMVKLIFDDTVPEFENYLAIPAIVGDGLAAYVFVGMPVAASIEDFDSSTAGESEISYSEDGLERRIKITYFEELPIDYFYATGGQLIFTLGEDVDVDDLRDVIDLHADYVDYSEGEIEIELSMISGLSTAVAGKFVMTITYRGFEIIYEYYVHDPENPEVVDINPYDYLLWISQTGEITGYISITYTNNETKTVTSDYGGVPWQVDMAAALSSGDLLITGYNLTISGPQTVTVTYLGCTVELTVFVYNPENLQIAFIDSYDDDDGMIYINTEGEVIAIDYLKSTWMLDDGTSYGANSLEALPYYYYYGLDLTKLGPQSVRIWGYNRYQDILVYVFDGYEPPLTTAVIDFADLYIAQGATDLPEPRTIDYYVYLYYPPASSEPLTFDMLKEEDGSEFDTSTLGWRYVRIWLEPFERYEYFYVYVYDPADPAIVGYSLINVPTYTIFIESEEIIAGILLETTYADGTASRQPLSSAPEFYELQYNTGFVRLIGDWDEPLPYPDSEGEFSKPSYDIEYLNITYAYDGDLGGYIITGVTSGWPGLFTIPSTYDDGEIVGIGTNAFADCYPYELIVPMSIVHFYPNAFNYIGNIYYLGAEEDWELITGRNNFNYGSVYYYSETEVTDGCHWRFVDGVPEIWELAVYTMTFMSEGESIAEYYLYLDEYIPIPTPTRYGYNFEGWYLDDGTFEDEFDLNYMPAEDVTVYAKWSELNRYSLNLYDDGTHIIEITEYSGGPLGVITPSDKEGFRFGGWYLDNGTFNQPFLSYEMPDEDLDIYARWVAESDPLPLSIYYYLHKGLFLEIWGGAEMFVGSEILFMTVDEWESRFGAMFGASAWEYFGTNEIEFIIALETGMPIALQFSSSADYEAELAYLLVSSYYTKHEAVEVGYAMIENGSIYLSEAFSANYIFQDEVLYDDADAYTSTDGTVLIRYIGDGATYTVSGDIQEIANLAFVLTNTIEEVILPEGLNKIGAQAFYFCFMLADIEIPESVTFLGVGAFAACISLEGVILPSGLDEINNMVLADCWTLSYVVIPESVTEIKAGAFNGCVDFGNIYYMGDEIGWSEIVVDAEDNEPLIEATVYYYSETETEGGWRFVDGVPTVW
ncbi:MAG TPA: InlB B-repeat-containing protein, partial [Clostridia bacterium]|nr:InlB B-repeat-containing protein [Clostridia bacterium]